MLVGPSGEPLAEFDKVGFTSFDKKVIAPGRNLERMVQVKGYKIGIVICTEVSDREMRGTFSQFSGADLLIWPGFSGVGQEDLRVIQVW